MDSLMCTTEEDGLNFQCNLYDSEVVNSMTELLLRGLATASVDSTTGDIFKSPSSVAAGIKTEVAEYLIQRSETLVRESVDGGEDHSDQLIKASARPTEFISDLIDDFATSKRNLLSHVSGFFSSESRLNRIKDFMQKMDMENFWALDGRKATAEDILKNIDMKCIFHCPERFERPDKLAEHRSQCKFRTVNCTNDGCLASFSAIHIEKHDSVCPFKLLPCEQLCQQHVMRCKMDGHCTTVCPMKLINCPFYHVGCEMAFPLCTLDKHCSGFLQTHLLYVLQVITRQDASVNDMNQRIQLLEKAQSLNELSGALDVRSLTLVTKEQEAKIKKLEQDLKAQEAKMKKLENEFRLGYFVDDIGVYLMHDPKELNTDKVLHEDVVVRWVGSVGTREFLVGDPRAKETKTPLQLNPQRRDNWRSEPPAGCRRQRLSLDLWYLKCTFSCVSLPLLFTLLPLQGSN